jgi:hypothetical protein
MIGSPLTSFCHSDVWQADKQHRSSSAMGFSLLHSPPMQEFLSSPTPMKERSEIVLMSPADSNLMFSLPHSPSHPQKAFELLSKQESVEDMLSSTFSPSIFSPPEKHILSRCKHDGTASMAELYIDSPDIFNLDAERAAESEDMSLLHHDHGTAMDADDLHDPFGLGATPIKAPGSPIKISLKFTKMSTKRSSGERKSSQHGSNFVTPESSGNSSYSVSPAKRGLSRKLSMNSQNSNSNSGAKKTGASRTLRQLRANPKYHDDSDHTQPGDLDDGEDTEEDTEEEDEDDEGASRLQKQRRKTQVSAGAATQTGTSKTATVSCNCKKSKCLKLYCDCFAILQFCDSRHCRCVACCNTITHETVRNNAIKTIKERNSRAFRVKINEEEQQHVSGCHCKNSRCLKKYCECFTAAALCGANCKCISCDNYNGSEELIKIRKMLVLQTPSPSATGGGAPSVDLVGTSSGNIHSFHNSNNNSSHNNSNNSKKRKDSPNSVTTLFENSPALRSLPNSQQNSQPPLKKQATSADGSASHHSVSLHTPNTQSTSTLHHSINQSIGITKYTTPTSVTSLGNNNHSHNHSAQILSMHDRSNNNNTNSNCSEVKVSMRAATSKHQKQATNSINNSSNSSSSSSSSKNVHNSNASMDDQLLDSPDSPATAHSTVSSPSTSVAGRTRAKNKRVRFATTVPVTYPFFGSSAPPTSKFIALKCLDYLSCHDLYTMSTVNSLWCSAATDEALWE